MTPLPDPPEPEKVPSQREAAYAHACLMLGHEYVESERCAFNVFTIANEARWSCIVAQQLKSKGATEEDVEDALQDGLKELWMDTVVWIADNPEPPQHLQDFVNSFQGCWPPITLPQSGNGFDSRLLLRCHSRYVSAANKSKGLKKLPASTTPTDTTPKPKWFQRMFPMTPEIEQQAAQTETPTDEACIEELLTVLEPALRTLSDRSRALFEACHGDPDREDVPNEELAERFGISVVNVRVILYRARLRLKDYFERHKIDPLGDL